MWDSFLSWYEKHRRIHVAISAGLFATQIIHLLWLTGNAVFPRLFGIEFFDVNGFWQVAIAVADYLEIPAIISTSLLYLLDLRKGFTWKPLLMLLFINSQWLHLFWITDEVVLATIEGTGQTWPAWLAWLAIAIDYLELPVIYDTMRQFLRDFNFQVFTEEPKSERPIGSDNKRKF
jgi:hypothetical protein